MIEAPSRHKRKLLFTLTLILTFGFVSTSLISYFVTARSMRKQIVANSLPLTGDTIYSEIQRDLFLPVHISSQMAHDTFLRDWLLAGEKNKEQLERYLREIREKYGAFSSFLVSETTRNYYYGEGVLKKVDPEEPRDAWYFRVRKMDKPYETNVDPDMANHDAVTVFVNYKVFGYSGEFLGATGVGLTIHSIETMMERYSQTYGRSVYFIDHAGTIVLHSANMPNQPKHLSDLIDNSDSARGILAGTDTAIMIKRNGDRIYLNSRYIPELQWFLIVEQNEHPLLQQAFNALLLNLALCALVTAAVLSVIYATVGTYQKRQDEMLDAERKLQETTAAQRDEIARTNNELQHALGEVKKLSGLLPICSSCKKIRDDDGYWNQIETYIGHRSEAQFSHGICPDCLREMYPENADNILRKSNKNKP